MLLIAYPHIHACFHAPTDTGVTAECSVFSI